MTIAQRIETLVRCVNVKWYDDLINILLLYNSRSLLLIIYTGEMKRVPHNDFNTDVHRCHLHLG